MPGFTMDWDRDRDVLPDAAPPLTKTVDTPDEPCYTKAIQLNARSKTNFECQPTLPHRGKREPGECSEAVIRELCAGRVA